MWKNKNINLKGENMSGKIKKKLPVILVCISMFVVFSGIILTLMCTTGLTEIPALYNVRKEETANKENKAVVDNGEALVSASATEGNDVADEDGEKDNNILAGYCTFYDYVVAPYRGAKYKPGFKELASQSINTASNYANDGRDKLTVGTKNQNYKKNRYSCNVNGLDVNTCIYYNDGKYKTTGTFDGTKKEYYNASQGIIKGLDKEDYRRVIFNVDEPGLFSDEAKTGKTVIKDYKLIFKKDDNGNRSSTYTLDYVLSPKGNKTQAGDSFFPLNDSSSHVPDCGYNSADGNKGTNYYFGMRYDVEFALNGYDDDLVYKFTGDDDLWVFLDGELVLDLGGIHSECGGDVDLWQTGPLADELVKAGNDKSEVNQHKKHIITVLYMERGGNLSNCNMKFTVPDTARIITIDDYDVNKTVTLNDWEDRTYDISLTASLKDTDGVILKDITNVAVRDYIDNRFNIIDDEGNIVITDAEYAKNHSGYVCISQAGMNTASGGNIGYDEEKNMIYVEWLDQTVTSLSSNADISSGSNAADDEKYGWKKVIKVKADPHYAGGNNVTTNGGESGVIIDGKFKEFPKPAVNVRTLPLIKNTEDVIFYGDNLEEAGDKSEILNKILETNGCTISEDGTKLSSEDFTVLWYKDDKPVNESELAFIAPDDDTSYKIKVKYGVSRVDENDSCTKNTKGYIADETLYNKEKDINNDSYDHALYTIHVVKGQLDITKCIDSQYTDNRIIRANQTFVFKIEQFGYKEDVKDGLIAVYYQPVSFDANGDVVQKTAVISGLKKGFYTVSEDTDWTLEYKLSEKSDNYSKNDNSGSEEASDIFIGETIIKADYANDIRPQFYGLDSVRYGLWADGEPAQTVFTNKKDSGWKWLSDAALAVNRFMGKNEKQQ